MSLSSLSLCLCSKLISLMFKSDNVGFVIICYEMCSSRLGCVTWNNCFVISLTHVIVISLINVIVIISLIHIAYLLLM